MSLPPPPGILFGTRGKLSKLRSTENLQRGAGAGGAEGKGAQTYQ